MVASAVKDVIEIITGRTYFKPVSRGTLSRDREFQLRSQYEKRLAWKSARKSLSEKREQHVQRPCGWRECGPFSKELKGSGVGT